MYRHTASIGPVLVTHLGIAVLMAFYGNSSLMWRPHAVFKVLLIGVMAGPREAQK